ncbi:MAG TPA: hypothetical protein VD905_05480 [Flavobacteriales bacterium]|nr:hypothetical protein [Flavobacteriales bacterium]
MKRKGKSYPVLLLFGLLFLMSCAKYLKVSAIPEYKMTASDELRYIAYTDQNDRKKGLFAIIVNTKREN